MPAQAPKSSRKRPRGQYKVQQPARAPTTSRPATHNRLKGPLAFIDVFVDDFIALAQGSPHRLRTVRRLLMHAVDEVLKAPTSPADKFKEPLSLTKLVKDGSWNTIKVLLGWSIDTLRKTIELPQHRKDRLLKVFSDLHGKTRVSRKAWQSLLGELRFASIGVPGSRGLFCILQLGLSKSDGGRVRITKAIRSHLNSFEALIKDLTSRPTGLGEIIPDQPCLAGAHDASGIGMGGVYFAEDFSPVVWRQAFPDWIRELLVTFENPKGPINNSDLEQAGGVGQVDVMAHEHDLRECTVSNLTDNTPTLSRNYKGATTTDGPAAYLCQHASLHQRRYRYLNEMAFLNGHLNDMADDASRLCDMSDTAFLAYMDAHYPQAQPWRLRPLSTQTFTELLKCLRGLPSKPRSISPPGIASATSLHTGSVSVRKRATSTPSKGSNQVPKSRRCSSTLPPCEPGGSPIKTSPRTFAELAPYLVTSVPQARRSKTWWVRTPSSRAKASGPDSSSSASMDLPEQILLRDASGLSPLACLSTC